MNSLSHCCTLSAGRKSQAKHKYKKINRRENSGTLSVFMITDWSENWLALIAIWSLFAHLRESSDTNVLWGETKNVFFTLLSFLSSIQLKPLSQSYNIFFFQNWFVCMHLIKVHLWKQHDKQPWIGHCNFKQGGARTQSGSIWWSVRGYIVTNVCVALIQT